MEKKDNKKGGKSGGFGKPSGPKGFEKFTKKENPKVVRKNERRLEKLSEELEEKQAGRGDRRLKAKQAEYKDLSKKSSQAQGIYDEPVRLNRFIALAGVCARREADELISAGKVKVNGKVVREMGMRVMPGTDRVEYKGEELKIKSFVYLLMNKPKNHITTTSDDLGRDTVMEIVNQYTKTRVYPVGRLDRNTTGLLLFTNDGDLAQNLTHPSSMVSKIYHARLDKDITDEHIQELLKGFQLEDGFIKADDVQRTGMGFNEIGMELHSGANHIVKRMLAHLGYEVVSLDRIQIGPLTKRGLPRGKCRLLSAQEVGFLKMLGKGAK